MTKKEVEKRLAAVEKIVDHLDVAVGELEHRLADVEVRIGMK